MKISKTNYSKLIISATRRMGPISGKAIAKELGTDYSNITKTLQTLVEANEIVRSSMKLKCSLCTRPVYLYKISNSLLYNKQDSVVTKAIDENRNSKTKKNKNVDLFSPYMASGDSNAKPFNSKGW